MGVVVDSGFMEVRRDDEVFFEDYYHAAGQTAVQVRTGLYKFDETESGIVTTTPIQPMPNVDAMVFAGTTVDWTVSAPQVTIIRRVYARP